MDKILAFSILSSSPADISSGVGFSTRLSWRTRTSPAGRPQQPAPPKQDKAPEQQQQGPAAQGTKQEPPRPRFAPEFDGINCFESIVSF